jgi:hypothetical protein
MEVFEIVAASLRFGIALLFFVTIIFFLFVIRRSIAKELHINKGVSISSFSIFICIVMFIREVILASVEVLFGLTETTNDSVVVRALLSIEASLFYVAQTVLVFLIFFIVFSLYV